MSATLSAKGALAVASSALAATLAYVVWTCTLNDMVDVDISHPGRFNQLSLVLAVVAVIALVPSIRCLRVRTTAWGIGAVVVTLANLGLIALDAFVWNFMVWG
jgi:hypothetical protein